MMAEGSVGFIGGWNMVAGWQIVRVSTRRLPRFQALYIGNWQFQRHSKT